MDKDTSRHQAIIGTLIHNQTSIPEAGELLGWSEGLGQYTPVLQALSDMYDNKESITVTSLITRVCSNDSIKNSEEWKNLIEAAARRRKDPKAIRGLVIDVVNGLIRNSLKTLGHKLLHLSEDEHSDVNKMLDSAESGIATIRNSKVLDDQADIKNGIKSVFEEIDAYENDAEVPFIPTGIKALDHYIRGFSPGHYITIGARPSVGKSALAGGIALTQASMGYKVGFISLEMDELSITKRFIQHMCAVDVDSMYLKDKLPDVDKAKIKDASDKLKSMPLHIRTPSSSSINNIKTICRKLKHDHDVDVIYLDYIQKLTGDGRAESREREVSNGSEMMRKIALELKIPVVNLAQLNRAAEMDNPELSHIRESGAIENDSHIAILIKRDRNSNGSQQPCELHVKKNRQGRVGKAMVAYAGNYCRFVDRRFESEHLDNPKSTL